MWYKYEQLKRKLQQENLTSEEYEKRIKEILKKLESRLNNGKTRIIIKN